MFVDCDGILSLWVSSSIPEGGELLFAGVELSACEEHHSQGECVRWE